LSMIERELNQYQRKKERDKNKPAENPEISGLYDKTDLQILLVH